MLKKQRLGLIIVGLILLVCWASFKPFKRRFNITISFTEGRNESAVYNSDFQNQKVTRILKILSWSSKEADAWLQARTGSASVKYHCKLEYGTDCLYVTERSEYNESHAVLFNIHLTSLRDIPAYRPPGQLWIAFLHESPQRMSMEKLTGWRGLFNASMSYMQNSDIPVTFPRYSPGNHSKWRIAQLEQIRRNLTVKVKQKTKMVAWFVSNCKTPSDREKYVRELSKYIKADVFGECGNLTCPKTSENKYRDCDSMLDKHYKFYLAFENSLCEEYVTEKFVRMVHRDLIPVVLGGADYSAFTAPETYLDVRNFTSPRLLAEYMRYLDKRTDLYVDYLMRKRSMGRRRHGAHRCELCNYLHKNLHSSRRIKLDQVWNQTLLCKNSAQFYKGIL